MQLVKNKGRLYAAVYLNYGTENARLYMVDVSMGNPGPMLIAGEQVGETLAETFSREQSKGPFKLEDTEGHVRCYASDGFSEMKYIGMYCPYSKTVEPQGLVFGHEGFAHRARAGEAWCPATQDKVEVQ